MNFINTIGFRTNDGSVHPLAGTCCSCDQFNYLGFADYCEDCA